MKRIGLIYIAVLFADLTAEAAGDGWPGWLERAPLNTDVDVIDPSLQWGLARAWRTFAWVINLPILAGLVYAFERERADYSNLIYVYFGVSVGSFLLSVILSPHIQAFSIIPIIALEVFLLARFCLNSLKSVFSVVALYHVFQIGCIVAYRLVAAHYA